MKKYSVYFKLMIAAAVVCITLGSFGCSAPGGEGFAIYLTKADIPPAQMPVSGQVNLAEKPVIGINDIISYNIQTHELKLTPGSYEAISKLEVPVRGKSFVVCVNKKLVYWGAFWTPISSISFDGVTIWKPLRPIEPYVITLELGYPSSSFYGGEDPRNNPQITRSLEQAGKLITRLSISTINELPRSMKGYELYSWSASGQWHFTLITGTNRNKTLEEVISNEDYISEAGWVHVQVTGADALKSVLNKIPQKEFVVWLGGMRSGQTQPDSVVISLPDKGTIDTVKEYTLQRGLDFTVQTP